MNQQVRFIVFIVLSVVILFGWQAFFAPKPPEKRPVAAANAVDAGPGPELRAAAPEAPIVAPAAPADPTAPVAPAVEPEPPVKSVEVQTKLWKARFTTAGAGLESFELLGAKVEAIGPTGDRVPQNLAHPAKGSPAPLALDTGLTGLGPKDVYKVVEEGADRVVFERTVNDTTVRKTFHWAADGGYQLGLDVAVTGAPAKALTLHYGAFGPPGAAPSMFSFKLPGSPGSHTSSTNVHRAICHLAGAGRSVEAVNSSEQKPSFPVAGEAGYVGIDEKYFLAAMAPRAGTVGATCTLAAPEKGWLESTLSVPAAAAASFDLYLGPKDVDLLEKAGHELPTSVDFGFFTVICKVLLSVLQLFQKGVGNWGIAIVLLTLLVKALTFPLTQKQMKSMEEMRRLAPKLEELKTKYAGDQNRINAETMKLYKDHDVQPLGGCVPMLVQMPVWFALYSTLANSFDLYNETFISGWILDLTAQDPYYVLPVLMTVTMVVTQVLTPQTQQTQQMKYMLYGMPIFFGFIMLSLPAGLVLYIFTNNLLSIAQSLWFRRVHAR